MSGERDGLHSSAFTYWTDGSSPHVLEFGREDGQPFVVRAGTSLWIPINVIVFAGSPEDAIKLVQESVKQCEELNYDRPEWLRRDMWNRVKDLDWQAEPYNKRRISKVQWACNDGVMT
jgi:hypothetical protein